MYASLPVYAPVKERAFPIARIPLLLLCSHYMLQHRSSSLSPTIPQLAQKAGPSIAAASISRDIVSLSAGLRDPGNQPLPPADDAGVESRALLKPCDIRPIFPALCTLVRWESLDFRKRLKSGDQSIFPKRKRSCSRWVMGPRWENLGRG